LAAKRSRSRSEEILVQSLEINLSRSAQDIPIVQLRGEIDLHTCPDLRAALQRLMEEGNHRIVLNMSEVPYLDSAALGVLVDAQRRARERDGEIYLAQVTPFVLRAFEITRLIRIFQVFPTIADATNDAAERSQRVVA